MNVNVVATVALVLVIIVIVYLVLRLILRKFLPNHKITKLLGAATISPSEQMGSIIEQIARAPEARHEQMIDELLYYDGNVNDYNYKYNIKKMLGCIFLIDPISYPDNDPSRRVCRDITAKIRDKFNFINSLPNNDPRDVLVDDTVQAILVGGTSEATRNNLRSAWREWLSIGNTQQEDSTTESSDINIADIDFSDILNSDSENE